MKRLIFAVLTVLVFAIQPATANPLQAWEDALMKFKAQSSQNEFAGFALTCLSGVIVTNVGAQVPSSLRSCLSGMISTSDVVSLVQSSGWAVVYQGTYFWLIKGGATSGTQGYYTIYLNKAGKVSEVVITLDATTD